MIRKFNKEQAQKVKETLDAILLPLSYNSKITKDSEGVHYMYDLNNTYKIEISYNKEHQRISSFDYEIIIEDLEKIVAEICNVSYSKLLDYYTYRYHYYNDKSISTTAIGNGKKWQSLNENQTISDEEYLEEVLKCITYDLENVGLTFFKKVEKNPWYFMEIENINDITTPDNGNTGLLTRPWEGWWVRKIISAYFSKNQNKAIEYLDNLKVEVIESSFQDEDIKNYAREIYERTQKVINGVHIDKLGQMRLPLPEYRQYLAKSDNENFISEPISDEEVDQFGNLDILGNYFINAYRADFAAAYIAAAKAQYGITYELLEEGEQSFEDTLEALDPKQVFFCANEEKNYTIVSFEKWGDSEILKTYGTDLTEQQKVLLSLFPKQDIVGISFQDTTGCAGLVEIKDGKKSRGFYSIIGEVEVNHGDIGEDDEDDEIDFFGIQDGIFSKFFKHPINEAMLYQDVSVLKRL